KQSTSNWSLPMLSDAQIRYAANDAHGPAMVYAALPAWEARQPAVPVGHTARLARQVDNSAPRAAQAMAPRDPQRPLPRHESLPRPTDAARPRTPAKAFLLRRPDNRDSD
ncbi:MAG: hypothetical protein KBT18_00590, partial [Comamonas sp.]|nr:hypothetical protein [Candidatus Comamonas equi]